MIEKMQPFPLDSRGWFQGIRHCPSPNFDQRPAGMAISLLVIHSISLPPCVFGGQAVDALFTNTLEASQHPDFAELVHLKVSAHLFIRRNGEVVQYVSLYHRAWHAGDSYFAGRTHCNDFSIGIELEGCDELPYSDEQYNKLKIFIYILQIQFP